jgi:hypothetical protein
MNIINQCPGKNNRISESIINTIIILLGTIILLMISACDVIKIGFGTGVETVPIPGQGTATQSGTATIPVTQTPQPSETLQPVVTLTEQATATPSSTSNEIIQPGASQIETAYPYKVQPGSPVYLPNIFHPESGCNWLGVAGQVFGENSEPLINIVVEVGGTLEGDPVFGLTLTGLAPDYGSGGYEIYLADHAIKSQGTIWIQLFDLAGQAISPQIYIDTFDSCDQNLILVNFVFVSGEPTFELFMPFVERYD